MQAWFSLSIVIPNHVWNLHIKHFGLSSTPSGTVHLSDIWNILSGKDTTYRSEAFDLFKTALFNNTKTAGNNKFCNWRYGTFHQLFLLAGPFLHDIYSGLALHEAKIRYDCQIRCDNFYSISDWMDMLLYRSWHNLSF